MNDILANVSTPQPPLSRHIPSWLINRLQNVIHGGVHFESSLYGPYNTYLTALFPMERRFMVKPQGLLRSEFDGGIASDKGSIASEDFKDLMKDKEDFTHTISTWIAGTTAGGKAVEQRGSGRTVAGNLPGTRQAQAGTLAVAGGHRDQHVGDISLDSIGGLVVSLQKKDQYGIPDFLVVKATETLVDDIVIAIIEIKAQDDQVTTREAGAQMTFYMEMAATKNRDPRLKGYVLMPRTIHVWEFHSAGPGAEWRKLTSYPMNLDRLQRELYEIAGAHWGIA
ncbi:hypothetical protein FPV67DRAFT_1478887 [Lyophyllum atratum]|nr:hypothetical protein FPV67DRAFT_1478887 [Lyophyllum atratum]